MKIIDVKVGSEEWLAERRKRITASDTPKILGFSRWGSGLDVCLDKWGESPEQVLSPAMRRGLVLENAVGIAYEMRTGTNLEPGFFAQHEDLSWMAATPDKRVKGNGKLVQIKTHLNWLENEYGEDGTSEVPEAELLQVLHELEVTGAERADLVPVFGEDQVFEALVHMIDEANLSDEEVAKFILQKMDLRIYPIEKDIELQAGIVAADLEFYERYVLPHEMPPDSPTFQNKESMRIAASEDEIRLIHAVRQRWTARNRADAAYEDVKGRMKKMIGEDAGICLLGDKTEKITYKKNKDTTKDVVDWKAIADEIKVPKEIVDQHSRNIIEVDWEKAVKASPTLEGVPSPIWDKIVHENTKKEVTRKGVRTFRVPDRKWKKGI